MERSQNSQNDTVTIYPRLEYRCTSSIGPRRESAEYLLDFDVEIRGECQAEDCPREWREIHLGRVSFTLVLIGTALNEGFDFATLFDDSAELYELGSVLFEKGFEEFSPLIEERFPVSFTCDDLLLIRDIFVEPVARGQRLGITALHRVMTDWGSGCALVAIRPQPIQFDPIMLELGEVDTPVGGNLLKEEENATSKLVNYLRGLGFRQIDAPPWEKNIPYLLMSPKERQMPIEEVALVDSIEIPVRELERVSGLGNVDKFPVRPG